MSRVFADYNATSPSTPTHWQQVLEILKDTDGNSSSVHQEGRKAKDVVEKARKQMASLLGANPRSIIFTSGATESNNWVIQALLRGGQKSQPKSVVYSDGEHASVVKPIQVYEELGLAKAYSAALLPSGHVNAEDLLSHLTPETALISLIHVHNELGTINPIRELLPEMRKRSPKAHIHIDTVQSLGKVPLDWLGTSDVDSACFSTHKVGGLKGSGCLYKKESAHLEPLLLGGGQENGLRAGTQYIAGAVSLGICANKIQKNPDWLHEAHRQGEILRDGLKHLPKAHVISDPTGVSSTVNLYIEGVASDILMINLDLAGIGVSAGTACSSGSPKPSRSLQKMGLSDWIASNAIRVSFGEGSSAKDASHILKTLEQVIKRVNP